MPLDARNTVDEMPFSLMDCAYQIERQADRERIAASYQLEQAAIYGATPNIMAAAFGFAAAHYYHQRAQQIYRRTIARFDARRGATSEA